MRTELESPWIPHNLLTLLSPRMKKTSCLNEEKMQNNIFSESTNELKYSSNYSRLLWNRLLSFS